MPEMLRKMRRLGFVVLEFGAAGDLIQFVTGFTLQKLALLHSSPTAFLSHMSGFWWLMAGLILLAFGEILNRGNAMRAELNEVI
ncbi:MAG: hypothetical protein H0T78_02620 [Longispora sp.]|nr:hypothetical protein [Longispora sp. (in: high G+C Gram-positive bacteria)]